LFEPANGEMTPFDGLAHHIGVIRHTSPPCVAHSSFRTAKPSDSLIQSRPHAEHLPHVFTQGGAILPLPRRLSMACDRTGKATTAAPSVSQN
jgi:hypothetical protein